MRGQRTRGRAASAGSRMTPRGTLPYFGQRQQRPEARPEDPLPEADRALTISELLCHLPAQIVPKPRVTTYFIGAFVIQESLQPFSSTTTATTTSIMGAQPAIASAARPHHHQRCRGPARVRLEPSPLSANLRSPWIRPSSRRRP
ncbi:hypothetical protein MRX96_003268 [Rhipicephalus microplus]